MCVGSERAFPVRLKRSPFFSEDTFHTNEIDPPKPTHITHKGLTSRRRVK